MTEIPEKNMSLFVYGTLMNAQTRNRILGREVPAIRAAVPGFVKSRLVIDDTTYPVAERGHGLLEGMVLDITPSDLEVLDAYETEAYARKTTRTTDGELVQLYVANSRKPFSAQTDEF